MNEFGGIAADTVLPLLHILTAFLVWRAPTPFALPDRYQTNSSSKDDFKRRFSLRLLLSAVRDNR